MFREAETMACHGRRRVNHLPGTHQLPAMLSVRLLARADGRELLPARTGEASDSALRERQRSSQPRQRQLWQIKKDTLSSGYLLFFVFIKYYYKLWF